MQAAPSAQSKRKRNTPSRPVLGQFPEIALALRLAPRLSLTLGRLSGTRGIVRRLAAGRGNRIRIMQPLRSRDARTGWTLRWLCISLASASALSQPRPVGSINLETLATFAVRDVSPVFLSDDSVALLLRSGLPPPSDISVIAMASGRDTPNAGYLVNSFPLSAAVGEVSGDRWTVWLLRPDIRAVRAGVGHVLSVSDEVVVLRVKDVVRVETYAGTLLGSFAVPAKTRGDLSRRSLDTRGSFSASAEHTGL
jgi:hypothetical protein